VSKILTITDLNKPHFKITVQYMHEPIAPENKTFAGAQNRPAEKIFEQRIEEIDLCALVKLINKED